MHAFRARYFGTCTLCEEGIVPGHPIVRAAPLDDSGAEEAYQHVWCAQHARAKHLIMTGQTFASRKRKTWRRV